MTARKAHGAGERRTSERRERTHLHALERERLHERVQPPAPRPVAHRRGDR